MEYPRQWEQTRQEKAAFHSTDKKQRGKLSSVSKTEWPLIKRYMHYNSFPFFFSLTEMYKLRIFLDSSWNRYCRGQLNQTAHLQPPKETQSKPSLKPLPPEIGLGSPHWVYPKQTNSPHSCFSFFLHTHKKPTKPKQPNTFKKS